MTVFLPLIPKTYRYLTERTKKRTKKLKSKDYKNYNEATQIENKINHLELNDLNVDNL